MFRVKYNNVEKIWSSVDTQFVFNQNISLGYILLRSMDLCGTKMCQVIFITNCFSKLNVSLFFGENFQCDSIYLTFIS